MEELRIALRNAGKIDPRSIDSYIAAGGYQALAKVQEMPEMKIIEEIEKSGKLRGRGGAGFNTGFKWRSAHDAEGDVKYIICNADEGEPGTYKDRTILENDPHTVLEGMAIAAKAVGAKEAMLYIRAEYPEVISLVKDAISQAEEKGVFGDVHFTVHTGAGAYVCGEETALLNSIEGKRGEPRLKPPYPTIKGLFGKPTVVNNVETFSAVPVIIEKGAAWYSSIGSVKYPGTKIFTTSGDIAQKGYCEVYTGTHLRDIIDHFGGVREGHTLKAIQIGGNSGAFIGADSLDSTIDIESLSALGASLGSGSLFVMDETRNMAEILLQVVRFFEAESCGRCTPCREGNMRLVQILEKLISGKGTDKDVKLLEKIVLNMREGAFCPLGQSVAVPVLSALRLFPEDFYGLVARKEA